MSISTDDTPTQSHATNDSTIIDARTKNITSQIQSHTLINEEKSVDSEIATKKPNDLQQDTELSQSQDNQQDYSPPMQNIQPDSKDEELNTQLAIENEPTNIQDTDNSHQTFVSNDIKQDSKKNESSQDVSPHFITDASDLDVISPIKTDYQHKPWDYILYSKRIFIGVALFACFTGLYMGYLFFGTTSLGVLWTLQKERENIVQEVENRRLENAQLQKQMLELQMLEPQEL